VQNETEKPGKVRRLLGWPGIMTINFLVIATIAIMGVGFGAYASIYNLTLQVKSFGVFQACYQC